MSCSVPYAYVSMSLLFNAETLNLTKTQICVWKDPTAALDYINYHSQKACPPSSRWLQPQSTTYSISSEKCSSMLFLLHVHSLFSQHKSLCEHMLSHNQEHLFLVWLLVQVIVGSQLTCTDLWIGGCRVISRIFAQL